MGRRTRGRDLWSGLALQRFFLPLGRGNLGTFPRLTERTCSPTVSAKPNWVLEALKGHVITPDMVLSRAF